MTNVHVNGDWIAVANTPRKPHEKERAQDWLDRLLDLAPRSSRSFRLLGDDRVEVRADDGPPSVRTLAATRVEVLRSLEQRARGLSREPPPGRGDGGAVVLCDEAREWFLLTRKDQPHPTPGCRGRLALVSGGLERGETFRECALRELHEEVRDLTLVDEAAARLEYLTTATLDAVQWTGAYRLGVFVAAAPAGMFARWREAWRSDDILSEATPICLDRATLLALIAEEDTRPGLHFVASHHVLRQLLA